MPQNVSALGTQFLAVQQQLAELREVFLGREPLLPGSLYTLRRRCGKPHCHCADGERHASTVLSYRGQGRPKNVTPAPEHLAAVRQLTEDYRRVRQARTQLLRLQRQLLSLVDRLEAARVQAGQQQFRKLGSPTTSRRARR